jgi:hypothetical protein
VCVLVFLLARGIVALVGLLSRRRHRDDPPRREVDDDLVLAA